MIRIHYLQHDEFEDLAYIAEWAINKEHSLSCTRLDLGETLPETASFDWLIIMGGKMGVYESDRFPWIIKELSFIRKAIEEQKAVIGICLGSQMVAAALGARVYLNNEPEIGFYPVYFNENAFIDPIFSCFDKENLVLHIHNDTFDLPEGAVLMASSEATRHQAFRFGEYVFAFQFHFETTIERTIEFMEKAMEGLTEGKWIQSKAECQQKMNICEYNNKIFNTILNRIQLKYEDKK